MHVGYLLFMTLLCATLILWGIVAIRDDGQGIDEDEEETASEEESPASESEDPVETGQSESEKQDV